MDDYSGITVLITGIERLAAILDSFSPTLDCISPLCLEDVADHYATMLEVMEAPDNLKDIGDFAVLILESGQDIVLPLSAFEPVKITIDELEESRNFEMNINECPPSSATVLAHNLAAEMIQTVYRNYRAKKEGHLLRKKISSDYKVKQLAAQTIAHNLMRVMSRSKSRASQSSLQHSVLQNIDDDQMLSIASVSTVHNVDTPPKPTAESNASSNLFKPLLKIPSNSNALDIYNLSVHSVPSVVWNDRNSLYVVFRINGLYFRSTTQYGVDDEAMWGGKLCCVSLQQMLSKSGKDAKIVVELYNEHLAIKDKLIGQCEFSCTNILDQIMESPTVEISGDLMESPPTTVISATRKYRGSITWCVQLSEGTPSEGNWHSEKDNLESLPGSARSKIVDVSAPNIPVINGISPRTIRATADALQAWEANPDLGITLKKKSDTTKTIPRPKSTSQSHGKPSKVSTRLLEGISQARELVEPSLQMLSVSGPNTARISHISEDNLPVTATTSITGNSGHLEYRHGKHHSTISRTKRLQSDIFRSRHYSTSERGKTTKEFVPVVVEVVDFFDKCFITAFHTVCSSVEMSALEIIILLDSLGHSVAGHWIEHAGTSSMSTSQTSVPFPPVAVCISHPAAFADCICQYVQQYPDVLDQSQFFCFTAEHAEIAIKHLIRLLKGPFEEIKDAVFRASHWEKEFVTDKRRGKSTEKLPIRPQFYDQESCHQILQLMEMPISIQDSVNNGQIFLLMDTTGKQGSTADGNNLPLPSFGSLGHRIFSMDSVTAASQQQTLGTVISVGSSIKSSLKRSRLTVYQYTLRFLDSMWEKGGRPWDKFAGHEDSKLVSSTKKVPEMQRASGSRRRKSIMSKNSKGSNQIGCHTRMSSACVIVEAAELFEALVPINRAYGFGISLQDLSQLANTVGGFLCLKESFSEQRQDETKSAVLSSSSLQWVKVLFPSKEIKHRALQFFQTHLNSNNYHPHNNSSLLGFYHLRSRRSTATLPIAVPRQFESHLGDRTLENESHILSLADEAVESAIGDEDEVDIFVNIPRSCLNSTSIGVSKLLQLSRGNLLIDDIHLGMRLRVADFQLLQRLCERFEWFDRPSVDTLEKLATQRVEVISVAELHSKGRVGVKLLHNDRFCDALPIEALQLVSTAKTNQLSQSELAEHKDQENIAKDQDDDIPRKSIRRKSRLHKRRSSKDDRHTEVPVPVTTATLIADLAVMQEQQEKQREEIRKLKQRQEALSVSVAAVDNAVSEQGQHHNTATKKSRKKNEDGLKKKFTTAEEDQEEPELVGSDEEEVVRVPTMAVRISSPNQLHNTVHSHPDSGSSHKLHKSSIVSNSLGGSAGSNRVSKGSKVVSQEKDFSWLKPPQKLVEERLSKEAWPVAADEVLSKSIDDQHEHHNTEEKTSIDQKNYKSLLHNSNPNSHRTATSGTILHNWNPSFHAETAEYTSGVYVYPSQSPRKDNAPNKPPSDIDTYHQHHFTTFEMPFPVSNAAANNNSDMADIHAPPPAAAMPPSSSFSPLRRPASAPAVERVAKKLKERQQKELEEPRHYKKFHETPPSSPPKAGGLGLSGFGYTRDGRKENAVISLALDENSFETSELLEKQNKVMQAKKAKASNDASKLTSNQFGINEGKTSSSNAVDLNLHQKEVDNNEPLQARRKQAVATRPKSQKSLKGNTKKLPPHSPDERYRDIELARTAKEATYKENYLLKQLKQMGA